MVSAENSPLFFLAFILLSFNGGIIADGCQQLSLTFPPMGTYSCPGSNITYTCVLNSSGFGVATIWRGSAFQCATNQILLNQKAGGDVQPFIPVSCGSLSAVTTSNASTCYTSVLTIPAVQALNGTTVVCGDGNTPTIVGTDTLKIITSPGPVGSMTTTNTSVDQLTVTWNPPTTGGVPTSYNVTINSSNTQASIQTNGPLQYTFPNLITGTLYTVSVVAINCAGSSYGISKTKWTLALPPDNTSIKALSVFNLNNTLRQFEITWTPVGGAVTMYAVYLGGGIHGNTSCTTPQCFYVVLVSVASTSYVISVASVNKDGDVGPKSTTTIYDTTNNMIITSVTSIAYPYMATIGCTFNLSYFCMVCCSTDPSVPPDSSVYSISTTRGTEVTVSIQGLTSGQIYYCKAAATNTNSNNCTGPVVGDVKVFFSFMTSSVPTTSTPTTPTTNSPEGGNVTDGNVGAIAGGVVGGVGGALLLVVIVVIVVVVILKTKGGSGGGREDTMELGKSGSTSTPPPGSNDGTGALYQDPKAIQHVQGPGGETYAMADKPTKTSNKASDKAKKPTATVAPATDAGGAMYQDPKDIQHTTTQAGETYAVTDKKPKTVGHVQAPAGDLYAVADAKRKM